MFLIGEQAVHTPAEHVEAAAHAAHGRLSDADHVEPVAHVHLSAAQLVSYFMLPVKATFDFQASAIMRL